jgi:hypothetical protein
MARTSSSKEPRREDSRICEAKRPGKMISPSKKRTMSPKTSPEPAASRERLLPQEHREAAGLQLRLKKCQLATTMENHSQRPLKSLSKKNLQAEIPAQKQKFFLPRKKQQCPVSSRTSRSSRSPSLEEKENRWQHQRQPPEMSHDDCEGPDTGPPVPSRTTSGSAEE